MIPDTSTCTLSSTMREHLFSAVELQQHTDWEALLTIITGETNLSSAGFPFISDESFRLFVENVSHLFADGQSILEWADTLDSYANTQSFENEKDSNSLNRALKVLRTMVFTAGVTAPPDLWLLRQILSVHKKLGTLDALLQAGCSTEELATEFKLSRHQLQIDLHFMHTRGYLRKSGDKFYANHDAATNAIFRDIEVLPESYNTKIVPKFVSVFSGEPHAGELAGFLTEWLQFDQDSVSSSSWVANKCEIETGYRLVPFVLALRILNRHGNARVGMPAEEIVPVMLPGIESLLYSAGMAKNGVLTSLGERMLKRGPGPFGIINAYQPYLSQLETLLTSTDRRVWVNRGENVAASQDANSKTFTAGNNALDKFCDQYDYSYDVFIEHAVGQGEATRQRFERSGADHIRYFGADLENAAIDKAVEQQEAGNLPANMQFVREADIGNPDKVIEFLKAAGVSTQSSVMMVGNGFHEIREQTNEHMTEVFRAYCRAGMVVIFTEETALNDQDLLNTAWNTYHAGFRYVHEISGQGLRPAYERDNRDGRWGWRRCAQEGGFRILDEFTYRSRTIYPYPRPDRENPSISVTYFCIPEKLASELGIDEG